MLELESVGSVNNSLKRWLINKTIFKWLYCRRHEYSAPRQVNTTNCLNIRQWIAVTWVKIYRDSIKCRVEKFYFLNNLGQGLDAF